MRIVATRLIAVRIIATLPLSPPHKLPCRRLPPYCRIVALPAVRLVVALLLSPPALIVLPSSVALPLPPPATRRFAVARIAAALPPHCRLAAVRIRCRRLP
jgi:hypothetical protein